MDGACRPEKAYLSFVGYLGEKRLFGDLDVEGKTTGGGTCQLWDFRGSEFVL
jgi:hypothetical protein